MSISAGEKIKKRRGPEAQAEDYEQQYRFMDEEEL